jgi:hypothetical protein
VSRENKKFDEDGEIEGSRGRSAAEQVIAVNSAGPLTPAVLAPPSSLVGSRAGSLDWRLQAGSGLILATSAAGRVQACAVTDSEHFSGGKLLSSGHNAESARLVLASIVTV